MLSLKENRGGGGGGGDPDTHPSLNVLGSIFEIKFNLIDVGN